MTTHTPERVTLGSLTPEEHEWLRGTCPVCGGDVISNCYRAGDSYIIVHECKGRLLERPTCDFRRVL